MMVELPIVDFSPEQRELWERVIDLWALSKARDESQIRWALHPEYVGWDMNAPLPHDRDAAVRSVSGDSPELREYELRPLSVQVYGGQVGVVHYSYAAIVVPKDGSSITVTGRWSEVYLKQSGAWTMISVSGRPDVPHEANSAALALRNPSSATMTPHLRIARPVSNLPRAIDMYSRGLGLRVVGRFENHDGFDGVMLGAAGSSYHFEFTYCRDHPVPPSPTTEDLVVLYIPATAEWQASCASMLDAGFKQVASFNPYWEAKGRTFEDQDGYRTVLQHAEWSNVEEA